MISSKISSEGLFSGDVEFLVKVGRCELEQGRIGVMFRCIQFTCVVRLIALLPGLLLLLLLKIVR